MVELVTGHYDDESWKKRHDEVHEPINIDAVIAELTQPLPKGTISDANDWKSSVQPTRKESRLWNSLGNEALRGALVSLIHAYSAADAFFSFYSPQMPHNPTRIQRGLAVTEASVKVAATVAAGYLVMNAPDVAAAAGDMFVIAKDTVASALVGLAYAR